MRRLLSQALWPTLRTLSRESAIKMAAVSYVSSDKYVKFGEGDLLVVNASDSAIVQRHTDAMILEEAFKRGATLYSYPGLHSKLMVLNGHAVIGSANLSASSVENLVEVALVTDQPSIVGEAVSIIAELAQADDCDLIDKSFIERIRSLEVMPLTGGNIARGRKPRTAESFQARTWIVGIYELVRDLPKNWRTSMKVKRLLKKCLPRRPAL